MSNILVAYSTNSGSTAEVAMEIALELTKSGHKADSISIREVRDLSGYDVVIVGAPMIFGWQREARQFLRRNENQLSQKKTALFSCAMRLTEPGDKVNYSGNLALDPNLVRSPGKPGALNIKEKFTTLNHYLNSMLGGVPKLKPISIGFFNGKLEMFRLKWWQAAFVMIVVQAVPGDYRDMEFIRSWSKSLTSLI